MKRTLSTCFGITAFIALSAQCSVIEVPLAQRASASTLIAEGRVSGQYSYWNTTHNMIYTANTIELYKIFKGNVSTTSVEIITEGGTVGLDRITVEPSLTLEVGQVGMFTCEPPTRVKNNPVSRGGIPQFEAYASVQGFVKYNETEQTASDVFRTYTDLQTEVYDVCSPPGHHQYIEVRHVNIMNSGSHIGNPPQVQSISNFSPTTITAGTGSVLTINGSGFGATQGSGTVGFKNADDGGATFINPLATQYLSWSSTQITVEVPANAGTGVIQVTQGTTSTSASALTISYAHLNVDFDPGTGTEAYQTDHINDNAAGGYTWRMNTAFDADASARASFMRAFDTWRCETNVNWIIGSTTSINDAVSDGTNIICFDNTAPLSAGILGVCYSYWSGCASGPTIVWYVSELDIIFDEGSNITPLTWEYGPATPTASEYDFETVAVHELGHGHQLGHVIAPGAIMHYSISNGTSNRSLSANDLAGGNFVQAKSIVANVCGPGAMTNYTGCASPPVAAFTGTPTTLCAGGSVAFTDQSTNTPTSWSWTFTGGTPSSSTAQNPTIVYSTPGTYAVSLTATNSSGSDNETISGYITVNANPTASAVSQTNVACNGGNTGAATVSASGGSGGYTYNWTPGNPTGDGTTSVSGLTAGTWSCTVTDASGCTDLQTFSITQPSAITVTPVSQTNISCNGGSDGAASVSASGGAGGYTYNWTPGNPSGDGTTAVTGLTAGTWTCTVTDANGCNGTATFNITQPSALSVSPVSQTNITCNGDANGAASVSASGGAGGYTYNWTPGNPTGDGTTSVSGLTTGTWTCTVTDANGCNDATTFNITEPTALTVSITPVSAICAGQSANLVATPGGGTPSYTYNWMPGSLTGSSVNVSPASTTAYTVTLTDANGCTVSDVATVTVNTVPSLTVTSNPSSGIVCSGNQATLTASGAQSYSWTGGITNGVAFTPASTTTYTVTGTGSNGCTSIAQSTITVNSCSGPTTTVPCGITISNKSQSASAVNVVGATQYRFKFYDNSTLALIGQVNQASRTLTFNNVPGIFYGTTYRWTVAVNTGSGFGAESSINCTVTLAVPQNTLPCGYSYSKLNGYSAVPSIFGSAGYRYSFYDNSTSALVAQVSQASNYIYFNQVPNLQFGTTYKWTVEVQYNNGSGLVFGPASTMNCLVTMNAPTTTVPCNNTYNRQGGYTAAPAVTGATGYRFTFYQSSVQVAQRAQTSNYIYFNQVNGIWNGNTYQWTVEVQYNNGSGLVYGPASAPCNITFSSSARLTDLVDGNSTAPIGFAILMYPNPLGNNVNPTINISGADQQEATVTVLDLTGRVITTYQLFVEGDNYTTELAGFPELIAGMYIMQVKVGDQVQSQRFVAE